MASLVPLCREVFKPLHEIHMRAEAFPVRSFLQFCDMMKERSGWVVISEGRVIGCISFSDWQYRRDILIHCFIDPDFHGRWTSRGIYRRVFDYAFNDLDLPRVSGYAIPGHNDLAAKALRSLGFRKEGTVRKGIRESDDRLYDMDIYGILKEERRF